MDWMSKLKSISEYLSEKRADVDASIINDALTKILTEYGWHPVSEPPDKDGEYLIYWQWSEGDPVMAVGEYDPLHIAGDHWGVDCVIAWMPLPDKFNKENAILGAGQVCPTAGEVTATPAHVETLTARLGPVF
jgi:hypothetical protein